MITVEFKIKPEKVDEALEEMREGLPATRNFQGCHRIDSYFDKKNIYEELIKEEKVLTAKLKNLDHQISLINKNDPDFLDMLYRQKFNYVTEDEIIIKLK